MAINGPSSEHTSEHLRQKTYTKNETAPTDYSVNTEIENTGDDTPAAEQWRFLQSTDEMSAALTQFSNRRLYNKRLSELNGNYDYVLEEKVLDRADKIFEALQNSKSTHRELMDLARELFPDESDLIIVLREFLRQKRISEVIRKKVQVLLNEVESNTDQKFLKSGINCALKARIFGKKLDVNPRLLRASYRSFLMSDSSAVETYIEWISNFGHQKRDSILAFIESSLLGDINALDASCSSVEFGLFLKKLCQLQSLRSAEQLFVRYVTQNNVVKRFKCNEENWLIFLLSVLQSPESVGQFLKETVGKHLLMIPGKEKAMFLLAIYQGVKNIPDSLFEDATSLQEVIGYFKAALSRVYHSELFAQPHKKDSKTGARREMSINGA
ncbi:TPA: type III secretion system gatekeeper subunit SctW [Escherichia fergusonii]|uniref:type III secretion system gatekeeper subunit SctW n=1 Tax=Escherichia fergusonii TaxID=564 RepID=UPI000F69160E|nr:type III secretion system gatekeeper subunit SctW [Escherichia fergusonii]EHG5995775.1 YopN family type III secretion system gatekeeper subunit [Escherichia fergusonii]MBA8502685.1 type III secretion system gatekeeper subunit SctW [Escherichia fergusonii]QCZ33126.1 YopN family type III secretion system gatekeeper subunit [Escherichia fergusonii]HAI1303491.1 YopN family type III secretion system gatekeeper subunit [Escherichia fergusonii]HCO8232353.1 type III secretion system gatekeeper subu